jgi:D-lactate dehydrogenase
LIFSGILTRFSEINHQDTQAPSERAITNALRVAKLHHRKTRISRTEGVRSVGPRFGVSRLRDPDRLKAELQTFPHTNFLKPPEMALFVSEFLREIRHVLTVAFYDTKSFDKRTFEANEAARQISWRFHDFRLSADTAATAQGAEAVCVFVNDHLNRACLEDLAKLGVKLVALRCSGFNNVDLNAAKEFKLPVVRVPAYSPHAVAEHAVGLLLTLNRKIHRAYNRVREHNFSLNGLVGQDIAGKTVGIVGTGKIGKIAAQIFRGFEADVIAYDPFPDVGWAKERGVSYVECDQLLSRSDIISLHVPLTPGTKYLLRAETFEKMKKGVYIVNTSRGKLIDTAALIEALKSGRVAGVALDVYEEEEGIFFEDHSEDVALDDVLSRLLTFPNVLITSHQAFLTEEALREIARVTIENLLHSTAGQPFLPGTTLVAT